MRSARSAAQRACWAPILFAIGLLAWASDRVVDAQAGAPPACAFEPVGIWKPESTLEANPVFLSFAPNGWVSFLESGEGRVQDFSIEAQAQYRVVSAPGSLHLEFNAQRGSDRIPPGVSAWPITEYSDDRFVTVDRATNESTRWMRLLTHRYFLTFAARSAGPGAADEMAVAMWTKLDGRRTDIDALALRGRPDARGVDAPTFAPLMTPDAQEFAMEGKSDTRVMMRVELLEADYLRTRRVLDAWLDRIKARRLPKGDPTTLMSTFLDETLTAFNRCSPPLDVARFAGSDRQLVDFIRLLRTANDRRHVGDDRFPFLWEPPQM